MGQVVQTNGLGPWDLTTVGEQDDVAAKARYNNIKVHFGDIFGICGFKGGEPKKDDPAQKWKGRFVFRGSDVKMNTMTLQFSMNYRHPRQRLKHPRAIDAYGLIDGHTSSQCDAEQAYVQSHLGGTETWVRVSKDTWPSEWTGKFRKPVVLLKLAFYAHQTPVVTYWESHCKDRLIAGGFTPVSDLNSMYWHSKFKLLLMVYVDDFTMSGPCENMSK